MFASADSGSFVSPFGGRALYAAAALSAGCSKPAEFTKGSWVELSASGEDRRKVWDLIASIGIALFVTRGGDSKLVSRPVATSAKPHDSKIWFMTIAASPKIAEADESVFLAYSDLIHQTYVSVSGRAKIHVDPDKARELWDEKQRFWFPFGPDEPDLRLVSVTIETAEYWDRPSFSGAYILPYLKTLLFRRRPAPLGENKVICFDPRLFH